MAAPNDPTLREVWFTVPEGSRAVIYGLLETVDKRLRPLGLSDNQTRVVGEIFKQAVIDPPEE